MKRHKPSWMSLDHPFSVSLIGGVVIVTALFVIIWGVLQSPPPLTSGFVIDKRYEQPWDEWYQPPTVCFAYDKNGYCTVPFQQAAYTIHHDEAHYLKLKEDGRTDWIEVTRSEYETYELDSHFPDAW